ncbi:NAD(P)/FAD-dependent oxidoreductase [Mucilaginibacter jinjuensis]|uniref:NAD(P)/FAD-dependent oxidoreductase n=1 Tax=Mucilaginibacter jinjuensis TaxID=1176721 RepID=A0ABY7TCD7_9SPHI|nr:NAD(P)/FAD-dependent oxidoreductase [Mucilaginibacter jinjuensis]WCT14174.1 NAD(P)/FAD-dependent oxidoreductase [Mucilaginibacter jinjuensis]
MDTNYDVIIIGGSYAGLQAATTLGRSLRKVLVIDSAEPCNKQTPHSHNFLTRDGEPPAAIAAKAKEQLAEYATVGFFEDRAAYGIPYNDGFEVGVLSGKSFTARKLLFASGVKDTMPDIRGFAQCWGISALHCPYCHGYEVRNQPTGILANGDGAFEFAKLINNWTGQLTVFTNGKSTLTDDQLIKLKAKQIDVVEAEVKEIIHQNGQMSKIIFADDTTININALYTRLPLVQHCHIPQQLGCQFTENGLIKVNEFGRTTIPGVYAAGDAVTPMRSVTSAVSTGMFSAAVINKELIDADF